MIRLPSWPVLLLLVVAVAVFAALPWMAGLYTVKFATRILAVAIFVMSLDILIGVTGLVGFGHAAFFGLGAYAVWFVTPTDDGANLLVALAAASGLAGLGAAVVGFFAVRTRGFYFIMVTLAASQMMFALFHDTRIAGGSDGASIDVKPYLEIAGRTVLDFQNRNTLLWFALAGLVAAYALVLVLVRSRFGRVLQGLAANETRMNALGFDGQRYKWAAFVVAGTLAGFAGALFASIDGFVPPEILGWRESGLAIMMVVLGGVGTLWGSILGAVVYSLAEEVLKSGHWVGPLVSEHWPIAMGVFLIAAVLGAPKGLAGLFPARPARPWRAPSDADRAEAAATTPAPMLEVAGLSRSFGGLSAVSEVSVAFAPNLIHAVIGPNGAGKTTFTNLITGALPVSAGTIRLDGSDITGLSAAAKARRGIGRSFQRTNILGKMTVAENCAVAAQARGSAGASRAEEERAVAHALAAVGLVDRADRVATSLSHGEQRQLEIAMLMASGARLLILDEPLAGSGPEETARLTALLRDLAADHTILLVEHDMDAVFSCADTISVLVNGRLIAHGSPDDIRRDAGVREAYLGRFAGLEDAA
ncbi:branched-chain amino acid ABC transporter ATP-binding protein/permease [Pinisolibacter sp.]|uniref:branched-chain amino acid ABC transporter ATP-binding protein/permease n=1 Tax=Pinisolibacter sp. TaxID=2172024 RepID=UPI002FDD0C14